MYNQRRKTIPKTLPFQRSRESSPKPKNLEDLSTIEEIITISNKNSKKREYMKGRF